MCIDQFGNKPYTCACNKPFNVGSLEWSHWDVDVGWLCPKCNQIYSPYIEKCPQCVSTYVIIDGELRPLINSSPPNTLPLPEDAGILKARI